MECLLSKPVWTDAEAHEEGKRNLKCEVMEIADEDLVDLILNNSLLVQQRKTLKELATTNSDVAYEDAKELKASISVPLPDKALDKTDSLITVPAPQDFKKA